MPNVALTLALLGILGVLALIVVNVYSVRRLTSLESLLGAAADSQRTTARELPSQIAGAVSTEVRAGLEPSRKEIERLALHSRSVSESLSRSHDDLLQAVLTLNENGSLGEWVTSLRDAVQPLQAASSAIDRHYDTAGHVLRTTSGLVEQWAAQREAVVQAFQSFSVLVERSAAAETTHLRDIESRLMNRLEEVAETNATVVRALSEVETAGRTALETNTDLSRAMERNSRLLADLIELGGRTQTQHLELTRLQQQVQRDFGELNRHTGEQVKALHEGVAAVTRSNAAALDSVHRQTQQAVASLATVVPQLQQSHAQATQELHAAQKSAAAQQEATARRQSEIVERAHGLLAHVPTQRGQQLSIVLLGSQLAATVLVAIAVYMTRR